MKKTINQVKRIGLIANTEKANCRAAVRQAAAFIADSGRAVLAEKATADFAQLRVPVCPDGGNLARQTDLIIVFGGDGTMLRVAREVAGARTSVMGVNVGGLGFLTAVSSDRVKSALEKVWAGEFEVELRSLIEAVGQTGGRPIHQIALNDFVISRGDVPRLIELEARVDDAVLTRYRGDGLIVSSPTGSTAYSLAAGGAIVSPSAHVFTLTPICPHALSNRSVIVSLDAVVRVKVLSETVETTLSADGQVQIRLAAGDEIQIRRSRRSVRLVRLAGSSFFGTLRQKMRWSGSPVEELRS